MIIIQTSNLAFNDWLNKELAQFGELVWSENNVDLIVKDVMNNDIAKCGQLIDFFETIEVAGFKEGSIQKFYDLGFTTIESILQLSQEDICNVIGTANGKKIYKGMKDACTNIPMYKLMGAHPAFGRGIGVRKMKALFTAFKGEWERMNDYTCIIQVEGFDDKTARKIINGYPIFLAFYYEVKHLFTIAPYIDTSELLLSGKNIVFTGFRNAELQKRIESLGGKVGSSVSSKTDYVVTPDPDNNSSKMQNARKYGSKIMKVQEFKDMIR